MSKNLHLLAVGLLSVLASAAVPGSSAAAEFTGDCSIALCSGTIAGTGTTLFTDDSGKDEGKVICTATTGASTQTDNSSTGTAEITFTGCKDGVIGFQCNSTGTSGEIKTNKLITHLITLEPKTAGEVRDVGILFTGVNVTFNCVAFPNGKKTVTGNVIGEIENPNCGAFATHHTVTFATKAPDAQQWTQITTSGTIFDLISGPHATDTTTSALVATWHVTYAAGTSLAMTC